MKIHHIGYAVRDMKKTKEILAHLGYIVGPTVIDAERSINIAFAENSQMKIELISPLGEQSPVTPYLDKVGDVPYHICYTVKSMEAAIEDLVSIKFVMLKGPSPAPALGGNAVAFLYHKNMGLIELMEESGEVTNGKEIHGIDS